MDRQCVKCEQILVGLQRKYCSDECRRNVLNGNIRQRRVRAERPLYEHCHWEQCLETFSAQLSKFCSVKCKNKFSVTKTRRNNKLKLIEHCGNQCQGCGYNKNPAALQFHHPDKNKEFGLGQRGTTIAFGRLLAEAEKCELLCVNCHAIHHAREYEKAREERMKVKPRNTCYWHLCERLLGERKHKYCSKSCSTKPTLPKRRERDKEDLVRIFGGGCSTCGFSEHVKALHFHHVLPNTKEFGISDKLSRIPMGKLIEEAKKCVLLCGNCHAERHAKQKLTEQNQTDII